MKWLLCHNKVFECNGRWDCGGNSTFAQETTQMLRSFKWGIGLYSCAEMSPLSALSAEVSPIWHYVLIFSRLMVTLCAQTFVSVSICSQSDIALSLSWSFSARILEILIVRFIYLCTENYAIDSDHTCECSRPYARSYGCICAYARLQSMMVCHTNRKTKLEIKTKRILDLAP